MFLVVLVTVYRANYTIRLLQIAISLEKHTFGRDGLCHRIVWFNFLLVLLDGVTVCVTVAMCALSPPRLPMAFVVMHEEYVLQREAFARIRYYHGAASAHDKEILTNAASCPTDDLRALAHLSHGPFICCSIAHVCFDTCCEALLDFLTVIAFCLAHVVPLRALRMYRALLTNASHEGRRRRKASRLCARFAATCDPLFTDGLLGGHVAARVNARIAKVASNKAIAASALTDACFSPPMRHFLDKADSTIAKLQHLAASCDKATAAPAEAMTRAAHAVRDATIAFLRVVWLRIAETVRVRQLLLEFGHVSAASAASRSATSAQEPPSWCCHGIIDDRELDEAVARKADLFPDFMQPPKLEAAAAEAADGPVCSDASYIVNPSAKSA
ncbi:MAG: hypothetical protein Q8J97_06155, partial [Flavobacteriaceae bacterium]|nr:hypothetical protein [Flavobacteriaceae bacterium]